MNTILVPLDGSEFSAQVLEAVKNFLLPSDNALILYRVGATVEGHVGLPPRPVGTGIDVPMYDSARELERENHPIYASQEADTRRAALMDELEPLAHSLRAAGYTVSVEADLGHPAEMIIERTRREDIALVAMTSHGRSGISRLLFGSVAEQIVRHVAVPVLILRPTHSEQK